MDGALPKYAAARPDVGIVLTLLRPLLLLLLHEQEIAEQLPTTSIMPLEPSR